MAKQKEVRYLKNAEIRATNDEKRTIEGYAAIFNEPSDPLLGFRERVMPGAFKRALAENQDVRFLMNHDPNLLMGRTKNGTLRLSEDVTGLHFSNDLPDTQAARDLYALIKRKDMDQCSFSFVSVKDKWGSEKNDAGDLVASRDLIDVDLMDASAVTFPVYSSTSVDARSRLLFPEGVPAEVRSALAAEKEKRHHGVIETLEDTIAAINAAVVDKFGQDEHGWSKYYILGTWPDHVLLQRVVGGPSAEPNDFYSLDYKIDDGKVALGELVPMDREFVSSERQLAASKSVKERRELPDVVDVDCAVGAGMSPTTPKELIPAWVVAYNEAFKIAKAEGKKGEELKQVAIAAANKILHDQLTKPADGVGAPDPSKPPENSSEVDDDNDGELYSEKHALVLGEHRSDDLEDEDDVENMDSWDEDEVTHESDSEDLKAAKGNYKTAKKAAKETYKAEKEQAKGLKDDAKDKAKEIKTAAKEKYKAAKETAKANLKKVKEPSGPVVRSVSPGFSNALPDDHGSADDCMEARCPCQNSMVAPDEVDEWGDDQEEKESYSKRAAGEKVRTKKVAGKNLTKGAFAFVGDASDTSTWKLPVHDEAHARNALSRFGQAQGIPEDQKSAVLGRIKSAAKKFGIDVAEDKGISADERERMVMELAIRSAQL